jgi:hypothetical protein
LIGLLILVGLVPTLAACGNGRSGTADLAGGDRDSTVTDATPAADRNFTPDRAFTPDQAAALIYCGHPADCASGSYCAPNGTCAAGLCTGPGCVYGYSCDGAGTCQASSASACDTASQCLSGQQCIAGVVGGGLCISAAGQCVDGSQCAAGEKCVEGVCTLGCASNNDCRDRYSCDLTRGICATPLQSCRVTNDCGSATSVCVAGVCVPRSNLGTCSNVGDVWDENGCVPNQAPTFTCSNDGVQDACSAGQICLYHSCWISCDAPNQTACMGQPTLNACKPLVSSSGTTYNVCATSQTVGSQCGPGSGGLTCSSSSVCINGFCQ